MKNMEKQTEALALMRSWKRPLIISHTKPDGDAVGSLVAMKSFTEAWGAKPLAVNFDGIPDRYGFLNRDGLLRSLGKSISIDELAVADGVIVVDTGALNQIEPLATWLQERRLPLVMIDHHITRNIPSTQSIIDEQAAATCLILHDLALSQGWVIDKSTAEALFVGIATDTGWFRHSNTDGRVLSAAADLASRGVKIHELSQLLYQRDTVARVRLLGAVLNTLELHCDNRLAVMSLSHSMLQSCGARLSDTEDMVNEPLRIETVVASLFLVEQEDVGGVSSENQKAPVRVNFRSKAPIAAGDIDLDVAALAGTFGGGGHRRAAGARIARPLIEARREVVDAVTRALLQSDHNHSR